MIQVLVVDDSPVLRELLVHVLTLDPDIVVLGTAKNSEEALRLIARKRPDVVTMDIRMPGLDGFQTTRRIMESFPVPVIIVTASADPRNRMLAFKALEAGAVAVMPKPAGPSSPDFEPLCQRLVEMVKAMSEVKVIRRWPLQTQTPSLPPPPPPASAQRKEVVAIGASTGGPVALQALLRQLPADFPLPVLVVQHIAAGFVEGLREWLDQSIALDVRMAAHGEALSPARVYLAPDDHQMGVASSRRIALSRCQEPNSLCPSVAHLFTQVGDVFGARAAAVLLSGMGKDGAAQLRRLRELGALTVVQDRETSVVYGMPGEAVRLEGADFVLSPPEIGELLSEIARPEREP